MELINSWRSKNKQADRFALKFRLGRVTILDVYVNIGARHFGISILNFGLKAGKSIPNKTK